MSVSVFFATAVFLGLLLWRVFFPSHSNSGAHEGFRDISGLPYLGSTAFARDPRAFVARLRQKFPHEWLRFKLAGVCFY
jgi:hypothetical protein